MRVEAVVVSDLYSGKVEKVCPGCVCDSDRIEGGPPFSPDQPNRLHYKTEVGYLRELKRRTTCDRCRNSLQEV